MCFSFVAMTRLAVASTPVTHPIRSPTPAALLSLSILTILLSIDVAGLSRSSDDRRRTLYEEKL